MTTPTNMIAFFTEAGVPKTGLSPTIDIWDVGTSTKVVSAASMSEVGGGYYTYLYTLFDETKDYGVVADGTAILPDIDRYVYGTNQTGGITQESQEGIAAEVWDTITSLHNTAGTFGEYVNILRKIESNKWEIKNNQLILYEDDNSTVLYKFNLQDASNAPSMREVFKRIPV